MRLFFFLLLLANVALYAYGFVAERQGATDGRLHLLEISPERIRIVGGAPSVAGAGQPPAACLEWGLFAGPEVARVDAAITALDLPQALLQRTVADVGGYWVFMPPQKSRAEVDKKVAELKELGVTDFFVVQEQSQWRNAISLGIFKTEEAANNFLNTLRKQGVRTAVVERRENFLKQVAYFVREPAPDTVARLTELQREYPGTTLRAVSCPPGDAPRR